MICKDCIHQIGCDRIEHYAMIEDHFKGLVIDDSFTVTVLCKKKEVADETTGSGPIIWNIDKMCWE